MSQAYSQVRAITAGTVRRSETVNVGMPLIKRLIQTNQLGRCIPFLVVFAFAVVACAPTASPAGGASDPEYDIITLLPKDAIPSIDRPRFYSAAEADSEYDPDEVVLGVELNGDARAYSVGLLSSHEIVNDMVGGRPIAVTW